MCRWSNSNLCCVQRTNISQNTHYCHHRKVRPSLLLADYAFVDLQVTKYRIKFVNNLRDKHTNEQNELQFVKACFEVEPQFEWMSLLSEAYQLITRVYCCCYYYYVHYSSYLCIRACIQHVIV